jgi:hypothetical protein
MHSLMIRHCVLPLYPSVLAIASTIAPLNGPFSFSSHSKHQKRNHPQQSSPYPLRHHVVYVIYCIVFRRNQTRAHSNCCSYARSRQCLGSRSEKRYTKSVGMRNILTKTINLNHNEPSYRLATTIGYIVPLQDE